VKAIGDARASQEGAGKVKVLKGGTLGLALANLAPGSEVSITPMLDDKPAGEAIKVKVAHIAE